MSSGVQSNLLLMDLPKALDTIHHSLLLAKLEAYGFSANSLKLLWIYLSNRFQRTHINGSFSNWAEISTGVPQDSKLGPLLFDNTLGKPKLDLQSNFSILQKWFYENHIILILDNDLMFDAHIKSLCRESAQKLSALSRINKYLSYDQKLLLVNSVLKSH